MNKIITAAVLFAFATTSFCQQVIQKNMLTKTDYLEKSKKQKKTGMIFLGAGAAFIITSVVIPKGEPTGTQINPISGGFEEGHENDGIKAALGLTGFVSMLGSIPFFIASGKNKRRANAVSASIKTDNSSVVRGYVMTKITYPSISLKISL